MVRKADPQEVARHDNVTQTIITGILASTVGAAVPAASCVRAAQEIMDMIKRRGYEPQIRSLNQLKDGTRI